MRYAALAFLLIVLIGGCVHKHDEIKTEEHVAIKRTLWTDKSEIFIEYDAPKTGISTGFLLHLTELKGFKPVTQGVLSLKFTTESGEPINVMVNAPERPGIYKASVTFKQKGNYTLTGSLEGKSYSDRFVMKDIDVINQNEKHVRKEPEKNGADIAFLKEQQWAVDFMTALPEKRGIYSSFISLGELIPASNADIILSSPVSGVVSLSKMLPHAGKKAEKGEVIAIIEPPVSQQGGMGHLSASYAEAKNRAVLAEKEYERAKRLLEAKAVPQRRLDEAEIALKTAQAALAPLEKAFEDMKMVSLNGRVAIRTPLSGTVAELFTSNGKAVEAGQPVVRIVNTATVWLKANVPASEIGKLKNLNKATFSIEGIKDTFNPSRLVAVNNMVDPNSRTVAVIFEANNSKGLMKVGMFAEVSITTDFVENALTIPGEAIFEDEGRYFVFIQKDGETFERREIKTGIKGKGYVQIISGLNEGERAVTKGGYYVKLASMSSRLPQGHGHDH